jgi:upstream activation factor subunit UAF30
LWALFSNVSRNLTRLSFPTTIYIVAHEKNKYLGAHIEPFRPVTFESPSAAKKRKLASAGVKSKADKVKKPRKTGTQPPYRLSDDLSSIVGTDVLPRPQVVSKLWEYIKGHDLQNPSDKREIICDAKLAKIFKGKTKVNMFQMNQFISPHLIEKVDRSEYQHENDE